MKTALKIVAAAVVVYLMFAFVLWSANPAFWSEDARFAFAMAFYILAFYLLMWDKLFGK